MHFFTVWKTDLQWSHFSSTACCCKCPENPKTNMMVGWSLTSLFSTNRLYQRRKTNTNSSSHYC